MPSIAIIAFHMYPDPEIGAKRVSELANYLVECGWDVTAIAQTTRGHDPSRQLRGEITCVRVEQPTAVALRILRLLGRSSPGAPSGSRQGEAAPALGPRERALPARALAQIEWHYHRIVGVLDGTKKWSLAAILAFLRTKRMVRAGCIMVSGPPWTPVFAGSLIGWHRRLPALVDFRDPWLDRVREPREYVGLRRWVDLKCEAFCVRHAGSITVTTAAFGKTLARRYPEFAHKIHVIRNGYDENLVISAAAPAGRLSMLYAGTIYMNRNPLPLLQGIADLLAMPGVERSLVRLQLVGECEEWNGRRVSDIVRELGIDDVVAILPPVSGSRVREMTMQANVVVNFAQGQPEQVPAKLYEQFVSNRYGLLFAEAHSESAVIAASVGTIFRVDDCAIQVLGALRHLYDELVVSNRAPVVVSPIDVHSRANSNRQFAQALRELSSADHRQ